MKLKGYYGRPARCNRELFASVVDHLRAAKFEGFTAHVRMNSNRSYIRVGCFEPGDGKLITMVTIHVTGSHADSESFWDEGETGEVPPSRRLQRPSPDEPC